MHKRFKWVALVLLTLTYSVAKTPVDGTVVAVNGDVILESDVESFQKRIQSKSAQDVLGINPKSIESRQDILNLLIEEKIIDQEVKRMDLKVGDEEINAQVRMIVRRNNITEAQLTDRLRMLGTTMKDYREGLRRQMERRGLIDKEFKPSEISDDQLRHFYDRNAKGKEGTEHQYRIAHILVESKHPDAKKRVDQIYKMVKDTPAKFEAVAKDASDDGSTRETGGVLGYFYPSQLAKEFREVVPKTKVGAVSKPLQTKLGYHILKVLDSRKSDFSTLTKEQKEDLKNQMVASEVQSRMASWLEKKKKASAILYFTQNQKQKSG